MICVSRSAWARVNKAFYLPTHQAPISSYSSQSRSWMLLSIKWSDLLCLSFVDHDHLQVADYSKTQEFSLIIKPNFPGSFTWRIQSFCWTPSPPTHTSIVCWAQCRVTFLGNLVFMAKFLIGGLPSSGEWAWSVAGFYYMFRGIEKKCEPRFWNVPSSSWKMEPVTTMKHNDGHFCMKRLPRIPHLRSPHRPRIAGHSYSGSSNTKDSPWAPQDITALRPEVKPSCLGIR